jgi:hypothetical protein
MVDFGSGVEEYQSDLLSSVATFAHSLDCSFFSVQVGQQCASYCFVDLLLLVTSFVG